MITSDHNENLHTNEGNFRFSVSCFKYVLMFAGDFICSLNDLGLKPRATRYGQSNLCPDQKLVIHTVIV